VSSHNKCFQRVILGDFQIPLFPQILQTVQFPRPVIIDTKSPPETSLKQKLKKRQTDKR
jgi:hypothetical protein